MPFMSLAVMFNLSCIFVQLSFYEQINDDDDGDDDDDDDDKNWNILQVAVRQFQEDAKDASFGMHLTLSALEALRNAL